MLVLGRKCGESIILQTSDGEIEITLLSGNHHNVRLGFEAPDSVNIVRSELFERDDYERNHS